MTVTPDQARMLATLATNCRPNGARRWDTAGIMAALKQVSDRGLAEVIMATIRAASDRDCETPGVIPTAGSHWREQVGAAGFTPTAVPVGTRCTVCGKGEHPVTDHAFRRPQPKPTPETVTERVASLKAELAPTSGPTDRRTLEDLAAANPELHERVERVRAQMPKGPAMREPMEVAMDASGDAT